MQGRDLEALIERHDPAWPRVLEWIGEAAHPVEAERSRRAVPMTEQWGLHNDLAVQFRATGDR